MNKSGSRLAALFCVLVFAALPSWARVDVQVDRSQVYMGDSLRLTLTANNGEDVGATNLQAILNDFEILDRAVSSNISIVNGKRTSTKELRLELTPRRTGELRIPALEIDGVRTREMRIFVSEAPTLDTGGQTVIFEAEVDRESVYVQGQLILTLRLSQAINLDGRSISEIELDNAFVKTLEQNSFQRRINGRPWLVHEVRYAIFPEQSGSLQIPAQTFSGRIREARRSLFDSGRGRLVRRQSEAITVTVKPRPAEYPGETWLPARRVDLIEEWSVPPEQLQAGESATRTVRIVGEGLQGAQLPPVLFTPLEGLKFYPDQPQISDREVTSGLQGVRTDSAAVVPTQEGVFEIPEIRIPWWDTEREQLRYAVLPGRSLNVAAAQPGNSAPGSIDAATAAPVPGTTQQQDAHLLVWQLIAAVSVAGWLLTLAALWRLSKAPRTMAAQQAPVADGERRLFKALLTACAENDALRTRDACIRWSNSLEHGLLITTLEAAADYFEDEDFRAELQRLDASLYGTAQADWNGARLAECAKSVRTSKKSAGERNKDLQLYPTANA
ncbi:MAG: protein BatD [Halioglobus sp.]|nr:protein BatD [Halioglobus sp.]